MAVKEKKIYKRDYFLYFKNDHIEVDENQYYNTLKGDSAVLGVGYFSKTVLEAKVNSTYGKFQIGRTTTSKEMLTVLIPIFILALTGLFSFENIDRLTKGKIPSILLWVLYSVSMFAGTLVSIKLLFVVFGSVEKL
ncbi:hypothetical protein [Reichenbachiella sp.]|uniref:hypothetical protein n=1 Tax=Reichenbachiella sp. TaxID=2184521 RepID=UPI0032990108